MQEVKIEYKKYHLMERIRSGDSGETRTYRSVVVNLGLTNEGNIVPIVIETGKLSPVWGPYEIIGMSYMSEVIKTEMTRRI